MKPPPELSEKWCEMNIPTGPETETDHDPLPGSAEVVPRDSLVPAKLNDAVYKPVDPDDVEVRGLADAIRRHGLLQPIVITRDGVIVSGHRRHVACELAGLREVRVCRLDVLSDDPAFPTLLVEFNRQRVKTTDEAIREEILLTNPEESYRELAAYRRQASRVTVETIALRDRRKRSRISMAKAPFLNAVRRVVADLEEFWPLSVRQGHYNLLNAPPLIHAGKPKSAYRNDAKSYKSLIALLTQARLEGDVPFAAVGDETRPVTNWPVFPAAAPFVRRELDQFLKNYWRDLLKSQPNFVVLVGEKLTVESIIRPVAMDYTVPVVIGRGYSSLPPRYEIAQRFRKSGKDRLVLVVVSDHDPEGEDIPHSLATSMRDDFGIAKVDAVKAGLTRPQVDDLRLTPNTTAKEKSSRRSGFVTKYGEAVFELEAVPPTRLQEFVRTAIEGVLDMDLFLAEQGRERQDARELSAYRERVCRALVGATL